MKLNNVFARYLFLASVEAVAQTCSVKKVFLKISQNFFYRTPLVAASASADYFFHYWIKTTRFLVKNRKNSNERWNYVSKAVRRHQKILGQKVKFCSYFLWIFVFNKRQYQWSYSNNLTKQFLNGLSLWYLVDKSNIFFSRQIVSQAWSH